VSKTIVITGAGGFLGQNLIERFLHINTFKVTALTSKKDLLLSKFGHIDSFEVSDTVPKNSDFMINCSFPRGTDGAQLALGMDYIVKIYSEAKDSGVKAVINISSQSVYSEFREGAVSEDAELNLESKYAVGKYAVELLTNSIFSDIPHTNIRMASLIGSGFDQRVTNIFARRAAEGRDINISQTNQMFGYMDVRDASIAIEKMITSPVKLWREEFNLGIKGAYSLQMIADSVVKAGRKYGIKEIKVKTSSEIAPNGKSSELNAERFCHAFGWEPIYTLDESIDKILFDIITEKMASM